MTGKHRARGWHCKPRGEWIRLRGWDFDMYQVFLVRWERV